MKLKSLQKVLSNQKIGFGLFMNFSLNKRDKSIYYFTGVDPEFACLVVPAKKSPFLIVGKLEEEKVKKESKVRVKVLEKKLFEQIKKEAGNAKRIGVNFNIISLSESRRIKKHFKGAKLVDIGKDVFGLRIEKTKNEIAKIKKACKVTDKIFSKLISNFKFKKESDVAEFIEKEAKKNNCRLAFPTIVASGKNSSMPHYDKNNKNLRKGFCVIDFGVNYQGYSSDMTRTIYIGKPSDKEIEEYNKVLRVQKEVIKQLKEGVDFKKLDDAARKVLGKSFLHGLGHGIGIDIHEPISVDKKKAILKQNTVLTVEPGVYHKGRYGIRIEDDVLITKKGCEVLTKSKKELVVVTTPEY